MLADIADDHVSRFNQALGQQALNNSFPHSATAYKSYVHHNLLSSKMALPILSMVAPSSTATSKSSVIPMERCCNPNESRSSLSFRKTGRTVSGSAVHGA